jgi:hypothetical protein
MNLMAPHELEIAVTRNVSHLFLSIERDPFDATCCRLATEALMEILGLVPSNPRRNTSMKKFESRLSGSKVVPKRLHGAALEPLRCRFLPAALLSGNKPATCCHFGIAQVQWRQSLHGW